MSENFGKCKYCDGKGYKIVIGTQIDCLACDGEGVSKDATDIAEADYEREFERDNLGKGGDILL